MSDERTEVQALADQIAGYVEKTDWVSQAEIINRFGGEALCGDVMLSMDEMNVALFVGASQLFADAVMLLQAERPKRVVLVPCSFLTLLIDGCPIPATMPLATKKPRGGRFKKTHFLPTCFRPASTEKPPPARKRSTSDTMR
jgi:hypothetical protein